MHRGDLASDALKTFARTGESIETRKWAIFWLAMVRSSDGADVDATINAALRKDVDEDVREQAIFALSRLPDERATKALIAVAEDQSLTHEQRKRAVFWLSQLESGAAQAYLEKVLALSATR
jgi:HEAT repeat protein